MAEKVGDFGGLPEDLFTDTINFLRGEIAAAGASAANALVALGALAEEEHSGANPKIQPPIVDVVFKLIDLKSDLVKLKAASAAGSGTLPAALGAFAAQLNALRDYWAGR